MPSDVYARAIPVTISWIVIFSVIKFPAQPSLKVAPRHPAKNAECYQGSRPLRPVGSVHYAGLAAPYNREQGHLMIWPPEHRYRWAGGGSAD
jgi:hypothetical protein